MDIEQRQNEVSAPSVKQELAAIKMLFNWLVIGKVLQPTRHRPCADRSMW
jgi:site-specific recombinase XerD